MRCDNTIHMAFYLAFCLLNTAFSDITASFLLPDVPGQVWKKVGYLNMSDQTQQCPDSWESISSPVASCGKKDSGPCDSVNISTSGASYQMVCGRFSGYQVGSPDAFVSFAGLGWNLETYYVDGVSITYGSPGNRHHVYTYAAGVTELSVSSSACPCAGGTPTPLFVGSDYYCESGNPNPTWYDTTFYYYDVLWDGHLCRNAEATCCDPLTLPWFCRTFHTPITENMEVRICLDEDLNNENVALEFFELYILDSRIQISPSPTTETATSIVPTNVRNNNDLSIGAVPIGLISGAVIIAVLSLVIAIIVAIRCSIVKREGSAHSVNTQMEEDHAYEEVNKRAASDMMDIETCPAYGVVQ